MKLIERLKELDAKATPGPWNMATSFTETDDLLMEEMRNTLPKLLAVVDAAKLAERHLNAYQMKDTGLTDALAALEQP